MSYALRFIFTLAISLMATASHAIDIGNESMADKADRFDFEEFHKEKGIVIWDDKKQETTTYEEKPTTDDKATPSTTPTAGPSSKSNPRDDKRRFEKGQELKVREAYRLGNDPALRHIPSLFEATETLHRQLTEYCPNGWAKKEEWHKPEQGYYFVHYQAVCL